MCIFYFILFFSTDRNQFLFEDNFIILNYVTLGRYSLIGIDRNRLFMTKLEPKIRIYVRYTFTPSVESREETVFRARF